MPGYLSGITLLQQLRFCSNSQRNTTYPKPSFSPINSTTKLFLLNSRKAIDPPIPTKNGFTPSNSRPPTSILRGRAVDRTFESDLNRLCITTTATDPTKLRMEKRRSRDTRTRPCLSLGPFTLQRDSQTAEETAQIGAVFQVPLLSWQ